MITYLTTEIKGRLKMPEILRFYGFEIDRNRIACPFHNGSDKNCGVKDDYIHCFVCGESADQIGFVQKYFDLSFMQAIEKLNDDFCLGLPVGEKISDRKRLAMAKAGFERRKKQEAEQAEQDRLDSEYWELYGVWVRLDRQKRQYRPQSPNEELHPLFTEALHNIDRILYELECADERRTEYANQRLNR